MVYNFIFLCNWIDIIYLRRRRISSFESEYADLPRISFQSQVGRGSPN